ncbi:PAS domain S-box protein [Synoicihabitans lomoniglobus]|uniref:histidine kinase n=1 Tax=Synoicihabitans lomoniglobus TaxID=2909285 RepID=A0AAE9ZVS4_9BACT|nr:PAS domain S-box protein [Opitutaceae bacterium LMO-M01]WED63368.1 PAS domain S-box protein [Opitutaceae bacterium LMO-M01]
MTSGANPTPAPSAAVAQQIAAIVSSSEDAIISKNLDGTVTFWNRGAELLFGYTAAEIVGKSIQLLIPEDRKDEESSILARLRQGERVQYDETQRRRKDGTLVDVAVRISPIKDHQGKIVGASKFVYDITERKRQARRLAKLVEEIETQAQLFDATLSNITDLAYSFDLQGRWIYANKPLLNLWGKSLEEITGKSCLELGYPPDLARTLESQIQQVIETKTAFRGETPYVSGDGKLDEHEYIFNPVLDASGNVTAVVGTTRLITARKKAEHDLELARDQAIAAAQAKDDFLAALSHELRTPLNPVLLLSSVGASNPDLPPEVREDFELIRKNVNLEARLIDDLLDLTSITRGKLTLDQQACDLHGIINDALVNVRPDATKKQLQLVVNPQAGEHLVWGDPIRLQQILWNVLKNAVKFTPAHGTVTVETTSDTDSLFIKVSDTGIGVSPEEIGRIFTAFSQGDHARPDAKHRFGGLGLGLAISNMLVEIHGGKIRASSAGLNQGSTFTVELPLHRRPAATTSETTRENHARHAPSLASRAASTRPGNTNGNSPARIKILLVEDHAPTRATLKRLLSRHHKVKAAACVADALKLAQGETFTLVISDVGLPDRNGYELMRELRVLQPAMVGIALSGYGMEEDIAQSLAAGFSAHLVKPITIEILDEAIMNQTSGAPR